jgi:hypothetical protein
MDDPKSTKLQSDSLEPSLAKFRIDTAEPKLA